MLMRIPPRRSRCMRFKELSHLLAEALHEARPVRYYFAPDDAAAYVAAAAWEATVYTVENHLAALHPRFDRKLFECDAGCSWLSEVSVPRTRITVVKTGEDSTNGETH
jgi:hypothetical protein